MKAIYLATFIFCSSIIYSQSALNIYDFYQESFSNDESRLIETNSNVGDYKYHTHVGGISFQAIATPAEEIKREHISLDFDDNRFIVKVGAKTFYPDLPHWQLVPVVDFSNSSYNVVVSQSGDTTRNEGAKCRFHPAFLDNLLGLRLFQADLLNLTDILWDIPINAQREYIFAPSEQGFKPHRDSILHRKIYEKLVEGAFSSFVLTDKDVHYVFNIDESGLNFTGKPYYFFIKSKLDMANIQELRKQIIKYYNDIETNAKILLKDSYTEELNPRTNLKGLLEALDNNKQEQIFNPYSIHYINTSINGLDSLNNLTDQEIGIQYQILNDYNESFKAYWDLLKEYNPLVYSAIENTAHWSAFFRYIRNNNPQNWASFVKKVEIYVKSDAPAVKTPTSVEINYLRFFDER